MKDTLKGRNTSVVLGVGWVIILKYMYKAIPVQANWAPGGRGSHSFYTIGI